MGVKWTEEQQQVIDLRDHNILVSAAAGSGKTAVLVERIIARLTRDANPVDVDHMLIVTYTEAAAAEMKERIGAAIEKELEEDPSSEHLKRQSALIHTAKITTIHSFCLSVIREYFHTIDLDPGFRIAEEGELKLLKQDVMKELLEAKYEEGNEDFLRFVETFATGREDLQVEEIISRLYEFAGSYPDPEEWLDDCARMYEESGEKAIYIEKVMEYIRRTVADMQMLMEKADQICMEPDGPYMYGEMLEADQKVLRKLFAAKSYEEMYEALKEKPAWKTLSRKKDDAVDPTKREQVRAYRDTWKKLIDDIRNNYFFQPPSEMEADRKICIPVMHELVSLVKEYQRVLAAKKAEKNLIDFRDMEQFALQILTRKENGKRVPSEVAKEYQNTFEEVMIDEYQDSNLIQEAILTSVSRISRGENNLFMVGDVKQSIYRFRLSRPELFMEKFNTYSLTDGGNRRIDLHKNFRSRAEVLDAVNFIFRQIMTEELGRITYDENAALYVGASYPESEKNETEILLLDTKSEEEDTGLSVRSGSQTAKELEVRLIAQRIGELMESQQIVDKETGMLRPVRYQDIVILTRSPAGWTDTVTRILQEEGLPVLAESADGYFETLEIGWMMDYLRVLDNFRQDIPLVAVLKSPFGRMTNEELAQIRELNAEVPFYQNVLETADPEKKTDLPAGILKKVRDVFGWLFYFRERIPYTAIHDLLWEIMKKTGYRDYIAAMPGGKGRRANLDMLITRAKAFEATSYKGLYHFVRYIDQLKKYNVDFGEAGLYDEQTDAVRLMSIHKSKGLEFPIVIVTGMGKRFNIQDTTASVVIHPDLGLGIDAIDLERRTKSPTLLKKVIQNEIGLENLGEELRVLYVALTRAKEKLILTGTVPHAADKLEACQLEQENSQKETLDFTKLARATSYYDWILPAAVRKTEEVPIELKVIGVDTLVEGEVDKEAADYLEKEVFLEKIESEEHPMAVTDERFRAKIEEAFSYRYPYQGEDQMKMKYTVSELKKYAIASEEEDGEILIPEEEIVPILPNFMKEEEEVKGATKGTAYHKVMELLDFSKIYTMDLLRENIENLKNEGYLDAGTAGCIQKKEIMEFLNTNVGKRMQNAARAKTLYREQPFVLGVDAKEFYPDQKKGEMVLIQGIIDAYFEEDGEIIVLDYKTDRVQTEAELKDRYREQLRLYTKALEQITRKKVKEQIIYSFTLCKEIHLEGYKND